MPLSIHQTTIPVFLRGLGILGTLLRKGQDHASADPNALVAARLAPDMLDLAGQVQRASDTAKLTACRLTDTKPPAFPDDETTFAQLHDRIARTTAFLEPFTEAQFAGAETRTITIGSGSSTRQLRGDAYVLTFALPNFFFHLTTAYDILRHNGVPVGKRDYLWPAE